MTDKQIIIDGVDVSECEHQYYKKCKIDYDEWNNEIIRYNECQNSPNCHFKQLKRKEQEYEELKKELQAQRAFTTQEQRKIYCVAYDKTCETGNECKQKKCVFKDRLKYKQALDDIEKILDNGKADTQNNNAKNVHQWYLARFCEIRDIINEVKE